MLDQAQVDNPDAIKKYAGDKIAELAKNKAAKAVDDVPEKMEDALQVQLSEKPLAEQLWERNNPEAVEEMDNVAVLLSSEKD